MNIRLTLMTRSKMRSFFRDFAYDSDTFEDTASCNAYTYDQNQADAFYDKHNRPDRAHFAVMLESNVVGDLYLKHIDQKSKSCTLSIHMQNDSVKNCGYGTIAEILALEYAFYKLNLESVNADVLIKNLRSRHVLEKVGFIMTHMDEKFCYYRCDRGGWKRPETILSIPEDSD